MERILGDARPLTLQDACAQVFDNAIGPSSLMAEYRRGNLQLEKIGRRYFVTLAGINEMRVKCRVTRAPAYGSSLPVAMRMEASNDPAGSSGTGRSSVALDALQVTLQGLKKR